VAYHLMPSFGHKNIPQEEKTHVKRGPLTRKKPLKKCPRIGGETRREHLKPQKEGGGIGRRTENLNRRDGGSSIEECQKKILRT